MKTELLALNKLAANIADFAVDNLQLQGGDIHRLAGDRSDKWLGDMAPKCGVNVTVYHDDDGDYYSVEMAMDYGGNSFHFDFRHGNEVRFLGDLELVCEDLLCELIQNVKDTHKVLLVRAEKIRSAYKQHQAREEISLLGQRIEELRKEAYPEEDE